MSTKPIQIAKKGRVKCVAKHVKHGYFLKKTELWTPRSLVYTAWAHSLAKEALTLVKKGAKLAVTRKKMEVIHQVNIWLMNSVDYRNFFQEDTSVKYDQFGSESQSNWQSKWLGR